MAFPQSFLDELTARCDIVDVVGSYVQLKRKGANLFGLCPFHSEKSGSFSVSPDKQIYYCFGCKKGGGVVNFIMEEENLTFPDAVRFLAKRAGMEVPEEEGDREAGRRRARLLQLNRDAAMFYHQLLWQAEGQAVRDYLDRRQIRKATAVNFGMGASPDAWDVLLDEMTSRGYAKSELLAAGLIVDNKRGGFYDKFRNRLMLPVVDTRGDVVAFGSRVLDKSEPKYMNSSETPVYSKRRVLYGLNLAKKTKRPNIILCEGNLDIVTLHQAGFDNAVASMGTALTVEQTRLLSRYTKELVLCYDNDSAGQAATEKAIELLKNSEFTVRVLQLPRRLADGQYVKQDVDDFIKFQGASAFEGILNGSAGQMDYRMEALAAKYDLSQDADRMAYGGAAAALIATLPSSVEREVYAGRAAEKCGLSRAAVLSEVERLRGKERGQARRRLQKEAMDVTAMHQPKERTLRYSDPRSGAAEELVVQLLLLDASLAAHCGALSPEQFCSAFLGRVYAAALAAYGEGRNLTLASLAGECTQEEMAFLTALLQRPASMANAERALGDYIKVIRASAAKREGQESDDPLLAAMDRSKEKKGQWRKAK